MKLLRHLTLTFGVLTLLTGTACSRQNAFPVTGFNQFPQVVQPQQNPLNAGTNDPLNNNVLPGDITQGQVGSVVGRVITRSGRPLHNVQIWLEGNPDIKTTSNRGDFTLMNVPAGQHTIVLRFGNLENTASVNVVPNRAASPQQNPIQLDGEVGQQALAFSNPNKQIAGFKVDQDTLHQWQVRGIDVSGGNIYLSAVDIRNITRKGTVIKMNAQSGEEWKNIAKAWFGLRHPLNSSATGVTVSSTGSVLVVDEKKDFFSVSPDGKVTKNEADSAVDISAANGTVWISSVRGLEKSDSTGASRTLIPGVAASGGVGTDPEGNAYVCVQNTIVKVSVDGTPSTLIRSFLNSPTDVAIDPRNNDVYVLDSGEIKRYDAQGEFIVSFGSGALDPVSIDLDESGALYVADFARDHNSSQILKYEAVPLVAAEAATTAPAEAQDDFGGEDFGGDEFEDDGFSDEFGDDEFSEDF